MIRCILDLTCVFKSQYDVWELSSRDVGLLGLWKKHRGWGRALQGHRGLGRIGVFGGVFHGGSELPDTSAGHQALQVLIHRVLVLFLYLKWCVGGGGGEQLYIDL